MACGEGGKRPLRCGFSCRSYPVATPRFPMSCGIDTGSLGVRMADLVVVLEEGRIVQTGTHAELEGRRGAYQELYELQSRAYR